MRPRRRLGRGERRVLVEDLTLEPPQVLARLEAELLRERAAALLVGLQRLRLPTRAVEGEHELAPGPFAQRVLADERLELDDELLVASELEIGFDPLLLGGEAELVEARDLGLREVRVSELRQCGAAPERERLAQLLRRELGLAARASAPCVLERVPKDVGIELTALEVEAVSVAVGLERSTRRAQSPTQPRDERLQRLQRRRGRRLAPEPVDEPVRRHDLVRVEQQDREELALLPAGDLDALALDDDFERAEDPRFHRAPRSWCSRLWLICSRRATSSQHGAPDPTAPGGRRPKEHRMKRFAYLVALVASLTLFTGTAAAIAGTHPDNRATHGPGAVTLEQQTDVVRPDDRATHGPGAATISRSNDVVRPDDRATHGQGAIGSSR